MKNWHGKSILITGAAGFIGSHLAEDLVKKGASVRALVHYNSRNDWGNLEFFSKGILDEVDIIAGDLCDPFSVEKAVKNMDIVFHLGALIAIPYSYIAPAQFVATNVQGTVNVLEACKKYNITKMIHTSTSEVYGTATYTPIDEKHPTQAQSPYSASKIAADKIVESYYRAYDLPVCTVRPFNTYGPRQSARAVIPTIITQALSKDQVKLGALEPKRDLTYVKDTVEGFLSVGSAEEAIGDVVNIGSGKSITIGDLAKVIFEITGKTDSEIIADGERIRPENSEVYELICDNKKAHRICGWAPGTTLKEGLKKTVEWFERNMGLTKSDIYNI